MFKNILNTVKDIATDVAENVANNVNLGGEFTKEFSLNCDLDSTFNALEDKLKNKGEIKTNSIQSQLFIINIADGFSTEMPCVVRFKVITSTPNTTILELNAQSKNPVDSIEKITKFVNNLILEIKK
jgi:hypothetical protein